MALLKLIQFNPPTDTIYILGDAIDRGDNPVECLNFIINTENIHFIMGNHEQMMLDYFDNKNILRQAMNRHVWFNNGGEKTFNQLKRLGSRQDEALSYIRSRPYYKTVNINKKQYFLSHAGLDASLPFNRQRQKALLWSREEFYDKKALKSHICIFGHTPTPNLHVGFDCSIWFDKEYNDKICIDCGCAYGGALAAIRLDDEKGFYAKSSSGNKKYRLELSC